MRYLVYYHIFESIVMGLVGQLNLNLLASDKKETHKRLYLTEVINDTEESVRTLAVFTFNEH